VNGQQKPSTQQKQQTIGSEALALPLQLVATS